MPRGPMWQIMANASYLELQNLCRSHLAVAEQCRNREFWKWLLQQKQIPFQRNATMQELRDLYASWARIGGKIQIIVNAVPRMEEDFSGKLDYLETKGGAQCVTATTTPDYAIPGIRMNGEGGFTWGLDALMGHLDFNSIILNLEPGTATSLYKGDGVDNLYAGHRYWLLIRTNRVGADVEVFFDLPDLFQGFRQRMRNEIAGTIRWGNDDGRTRRRLLQFLEEIGTTETDAPDFLTNPANIQLWYDGFNLIGTIFQIGCLEFN